MVIFCFLGAHFVAVTESCDIIGERCVSKVVTITENTEVELVTATYKIMHSV